MTEIDITGVDLKEFVKAVYDNSAPQGMGIINFKAGELSDEDAELIVKNGSHGDVVLRMDYVRGRSCKMTVLKENGKLIIHDPWYDHTADQLNKLLEAVGIKREASTEEHNVCCACEACKQRRKLPKN